MLNNGTARGIRLKNKDILTRSHGNIFLNNCLILLGKCGEITMKAPTGRQREKSVSEAKSLC